MAQSFQNEIPKARVNITLDVETGGAKKKVDLPMKLLVVGDYSNGKGHGRLADRTRINVDGNNLEAVMKELAPSASFSVPHTSRDDDSEIDIKLEFDSFKSFSPEVVAGQIPEISNLLAMRNLLKDLKSNLLDNSKFRKELERIVRNRPEMDGLRQELEKLAPSDGESKSE